MASTQDTSAHAPDPAAPDPTATAPDRSAPRRDPVPARTRFAAQGSSRLAVLAGFAIALVLAGWMLSPRLEARGPSVIDDWYMIDNGPHALERLVRGDYVPAEVGDPRRYRPAFVAVWSTIQWHTLGEPQDMIGPHFWGALRLALFVGALAFLAAYMMRGTPQRPAALTLALLVAVPSSLVLGTPATSWDFARYGPVEPILVGGMIAGALILGSVLRALVAGRARRPRIGVIALGVLGYCLWLLGVYSKETSITFLAMAPFLYLHLARRLSDDGLLSEPLWRHRAFLVLASLMLLPVIHMTVEVARIGGTGTTVYGAGVPTGPTAAVEHLWGTFFSLFKATDATLMTPLWTGLATAIPFLLIGSILHRRAIPWLAVGLVVTAAAALTFQGLSGAVTTRYFIPSMALVAVAVVALIADAPRSIRAAAAVGALVFVGATGGAVRDAVVVWADGENRYHRAVTRVAALNPWECPVYMGAMDIEFAEAFPVLVGLHGEGRSRPCDRRFAGMMVRGDIVGGPVTNEAIHEVCATRPGWQQLTSDTGPTLHGCPRFKTTEVHNQAVDDILEWNRLVPGRRLTERIEQLPDLCKASECQAVYDRLRSAG